MFCPQCRASWPAGGNNGEVRVDRPKLYTAKSTEWGSPSMCPNCRIPLAADRIQGEFPSVAHASYSKEGSMTIKDVLRETDNGAVVQGEVPLDDKKPEAKTSLLGLHINPKSALATIISAPWNDTKAFVRRLAMVTMVFSVVTVGYLLVHAATRPAHIVKLVNGATPKTLQKTSMSKDEQTVLTLMPAKVGAWSREESDADVWSSDSDDTAEHGYIGTYLSGNDMVKLIVLKVSAFPGYLTDARQVHTAGHSVLNVAPVIDSSIVKRILFDFNPTAGARTWIAPSVNTIDFPTGLHTVSWIQPMADTSYVVTVDTDSASVRDRFFSNMLAVK